MPTSSKPLPNALILFGGTGFIGTAILTEVLTQHENIHIFVVSRSGTPPSWLATKSVYETPRLHFLKGDLLNPQTVRAVLRSAIPDYNIVACVSCVGVITPWSQQNMVRTCGDANINAYSISREIGARKFAVITRDRSNMNDWWYPFPYLIPGYYKGKRKIERYIEDDLENKGNAVCLRAGFVVGTRRTLPGLPTSITVSVPLAPIYRGLDRLCPTIAVEDVAAAAVRFVLAEKKAEEVLVPNDAIPTYYKFSSRRNAL